MLLLRLWNYLRGYVIIFVEGYFLEKFLNVCIHRQIFLWDIKRQKNCTMTLKISINGFKMIRPVAKKTKCRVRIVRKKGLPFILNKYRKRKTFIAGAILFVFLLFIMTSFIWSIEISGNKELKTSYIESLLSSTGIKPGALKYKIDTDKAISKMMLKAKELSWISIEVKGTKVKVDLRERKKLPTIVPIRTPCNIIASKDAVIKQIIVKEGIESVTAGDVVKKGQVLISGQVPIKNEKDKFTLVHALGTVKGRTWYEEEVPVEAQITEKVSTGKSFSNYSLILFTSKIDLFHGRVSYRNYDKEQTIKRLKIGDDLVFPFGLVIEKFSEYNPVKAKVSLEDAKTAASDKAHKKVLETIPEGVDIVKTDVKFVEDENKQLMARVTVECSEEIGITDEIGGD